VVLHHGRVVVSRSTPFSGTPVDLLRTIQAENFDNGGSLPVEDVAPAELHFCRDGDV
jgi:hypothetical protein